MKHSKNLVEFACVKEHLSRLTVIKFAAFPMNQKIQRKSSLKNVLTLRRPNPEDRIHRKPDD